MKKLLLSALMSIAILACHVKKNNQDSGTDDQQEVTEVFSKELDYQGISFYMSAVRGEDTASVTVYTKGLMEMEFKETYNIFGMSVAAAEVGDPDQDGSPELLIYLQSDGSGSYGSVMAFSVNNKKSMHAVNFPFIEDNASIHTGYMGHDAYRLEDTVLIHRYPIYQETDSNAEPTGGHRRIIYKLVQGEARKKWEIQKVVKE